MEKFSGWSSGIFDGDKIPSILVENKLDLLDEYKEDPNLEKFAKNYEFCGCFRTSAKTGSNVSESMEFLIKNIIKRMEDMKEKDGSEVFSSGRQTVSLCSEKEKQVNDCRCKKRKNRCC